METTKYTIRDFVSQNVLWNQSVIVEELLSAENGNPIIDWSDVDNLYVEEQDEPQEIFNWYLVTDYLADRLLEKGEPVLSAMNCQWWGRTTFGQLIESDSVIKDIYDDFVEKQ